MIYNQWTTALAAIGAVSLASATRGAVQTALSNTTISGYVDTAATWRPGTDLNPNGGPNMPFGTAKNDGFSLNTIDIVLDKPEDESPWAAGYHVEFMLGPDAVTTEGFGADGVRQAYLTLRTPVGNGLEWKVGVWDSILGYESSSAPLNPNYTRSYGWTIDSKTLTGILATYKINDLITVQAGVADSSDIGFGTVGVNPTSFESQKAFLGEFQLTAPNGTGFMKGATLTMGVIDAAGNHTTFTPGSTGWYVGAMIPTPVSALKFGAAFDYVDEHNGGYNGNTSNDSIWTAAFYSSYQATDKLSFNLRAEYLNNTDAGPLSPVNLYGDNIAEEITATAQYKLWANVLSRVEFRWDHVEHGNSFGANQAAGAANRANDFMLALNLIFRF